MSLDDLIGPLPAPIGRWLLRRMVAACVRYGSALSVLLVRGVEPARLAEVLRGADMFADWDTGDLLVLLPDTDHPGAARAAQRIRHETGGYVGVAHWAGEAAEDLVARAARELAAEPRQPAA